MMGGTMLGSGFGLFGLIGGLFNIVILIGVVVLAVWAVQKFTGSSHGNSTGGNYSNQIFTARETLDQRYARGELSRDEYRQKLHDISV